MEINKYKNIIINLLIIFSISLACLCLNVNAGYESRIIAKVKDQIITEADVEKRLAFILILNGIENPTQDQLEVLYPQSLYSVIDECLYRIHANEVNIKASEREVNALIHNVIGNINPDYNKRNLKKAVSDLKIDYEAFYTHVKSQILWQKIVDSKIMPEVNFNNKTVQGLINSLAFRDTLISFKQLYIDLSEIESKNQKYQLIDKINQLKQQRPNCKKFEKIAKNYGLEQHINFFSLPVKSLHSSIREEALIIPINTPSQLIHNNEEVRMIVVCSRNSANNDKINEISETVIRKKLASHAQTYLIKLRKKIPITIINHD